MKKWKHVYHIESVRQPKARIELIGKDGEKAFQGPHDIALIRLKENVVFVPRKITPVCFYIQIFKYLIVNSFVTWQVCLSKVKDENVKAYVSGFGDFSSASGLNVACWTNDKGPKIYKE